MAIASLAVFAAPDPGTAAGLDFGFNYDFPVMFQGVLLLASQRVVGPCTPHPSGGAPPHPAHRRLHRRPPHPGGRPRDGAVHRLRRRPHRWLRSPAAQGGDLEARPQAAACGRGRVCLRPGQARCGTNKNAIEEERRLDPAPRPNRQLRNMNRQMRRQRIATLTQAAAGGPAEAKPMDAITQQLLEGLRLHPGPGGAHPPAGPLAVHRGVIGVYPRTAVLHSIVGRGAGRAVGGHPQLFFCWLSRISKWGWGGWSPAPSGQASREGAGRLPARVGDEPRRHG